MRLLSRVVAMVVAGSLLAGPALAQSLGTPFGTSPNPTTLRPGITPSMTGGIPGTLGGTPNVSGGSITGGIQGTLGGRPLDSDASMTGAIDNPSTLGTSTTGSTGLLGGSVFRGSTGAAR